MDAKTLEAIARKAFEETDVRKRLDVRNELRCAVASAALHEVHMPYVDWMTMEYAYARRALYREYADMTSVPGTEREYREAVRRETKEAGNTGNPERPEFQRTVRWSKLAELVALMLTWWAIASVIANYCVR